MDTNHLLDDAPVYLVAKRALRERISAQWRPGDRLPPVSELARSMGFGQNNTHRAVRDLVAEGVLLTRRKLGTFVRRLPSETRDTPEADRSLKGVAIGMVFGGETPHPFVYRMMEGFRKVIEELGAEAVPVPLNFKQSALPEPKGLWGMVVFNPGHNVFVPPGKFNLTVVSSSDHLHYSLLSRFDSVGVDQYQGGSLAGLALKQAGCKNVCYIGRQVEQGNRRYDATSAARLHGFELTWGSYLPLRNLIYTLGYSDHAGGNRVTDYMAADPRPDGIFAASDELADGFLIAATSHGLKVGRDFHLVGFDGQAAAPPVRGIPQLTTVRVPCEQMGRRAADLLIRRFHDPSRSPRRVLLSCSLIRGNTAG